MAAATRGGSGSTSRKLPPDIHNTSRFPASAASTISGAVRPSASGTANPHCSASRAALSGFTSMPPGNAEAYAPISAPPCTPECPRNGMRPAPLRPTLPLANATLTSALTVSTEVGCWVTPMDHNTMALVAWAYIVTNVSSVVASTPASASSSSSDAAASCVSSASKSSVWASMNARSTAPRSTSRFSTAVASATSPPGRTGTCRSHILVPNSADSGLEGTQYRSRPGSR